MQTSLQGKDGQSIGRDAKAGIPEEPGARKAHAGICGGRWVASAPRFWLKIWVAVPSAT